MQQRHRQDLTLFEPVSEATLEAVPDVHERSSRPSPQGPPVQDVSAPDMAPELVPRERLRSAGPEALSAAELLAVVMGGDGRRSLELAEAAISQAGSLVELRRASYDDLTSRNGPVLSRAKACAVFAAAELGKRLAQARGSDPTVIRSANDVYELMAERMRDLDREHFVAVLLDTKNQVLGTPTISVGTAVSAVVHPREVFKAAIRASACGVILVHNHPTGQPEPSIEDRQVTERLASVGETVGIEITDHVIVAGDRWVSLKQRGVV